MQFVGAKNRLNVQLVSEAVGAVFDATPALNYPPSKVWLSPGPLASVRIRINCACRDRGSFQFGLYFSALRREPRPLYVVRNEVVLMSLIDDSSADLSHQEHSTNFRSNVPRKCISTRIFGAFFSVSLTLSGARQLITPASADIRASFRFNGAVRQCADLIIPCLSLPSDQRASCIFEVSLDSHCEGSELAGLAFRRWAYESTGDGEGGQGDALSSSENRIDYQCLGRFDQNLEESLKSRHLSSSEIFRFSSSLDRCRMKPQNPELLRP